MRTIAIMNNKGGVGKTVTAINLADILSRRHHKRVVLVDGDGQMNLTRFFLPEFDPALNVTTADILAGEGEPVWNENLQYINPGLELLPASPALYKLDIQAVKDGVSAPENLRDFVAAAREDGETDFCILDCPTGFTYSSVAALMAADEVIIPMLLDGFGFAGMEDTVEQINNLRRANYNIKITGVLIVQWRNTDVVHKGEQLLRSLPVPVFNTTIRRTEKVPESTLQMEPVTLYSPGSAASQDYCKWVQELLGEV